MRLRIDGSCVILAEVVGLLRLRVESISMESDGRLMVLEVEVDGRYWSMVICKASKGEMVLVANSMLTVTDLAKSVD